MLRRFTGKVIPSLSRIVRHQSTVGNLVSRIQHEVIPQPSPLSTVLNNKLGAVSTDELISLRQQQDKSFKKGENLMSCLSGLNTGVLEIVVKELRSSVGSPSTQAFIISELIRMVRTGDVHNFKVVLSLLETSHIGQSAGKLVSKLSVSQDSPQRQMMYFILCEVCSYWNNPLLGATVILGPDHVNRDSITSVVRSLLSKSPTREEISLDLILKIGSKYAYKFNEAEVLQIMEKLEEVQDKTSMVKRITLFLMDHSAFSTRDSRIQKIYGIILNDAYAHNSAGVYLNWRSIMNEYPSIMDHDIRVISVVLKSMLESKQYHIVADELVAGIPERSYTHAFLVTPLLEYSFVRDKISLANQIVAKLEPPVPNDVLSTLLKMNMRLGDYTGMEKVMQQINSNGGMNDQDYSTIVHGLLKRGDMKDAIRFTQNIPIPLASRAYLKLINHLIDTKGVWKETEIVVVQNLLEKMHRAYPIGNRKSRGFWNMIGSFYIKYLTKNYGTAGIWNSKRIYERSVKDFALKAYGERGGKSAVLEGASLTINPFVVPLERCDTVRLFFDSRSKSIVVKTILDSAKRRKVKYVVDWGLLELMELGMSPKEVKVDITRKFNGHAKKIGLREWESADKFENLWEQGSVEFAKDGVLKDVPEK